MLAYRYEIDGLRAIAVLAVVAFHLDTQITGGYVGVDVFFVISGFLITSIIWKDCEQDKFGFSTFYLKRIRRLFPALFAMLLICSIVVMSLGLGREIEMYGKSAISSILYISNFFFLSQNDYFASDLKVNPLLHTWSLSVEEQFYLVFPALLYFLHKYQKARATVAIGIVAIISLVLSESLLYIDKPTAFFISPSRFWQFLTGSLLALTSTQIRINRTISELIALTGLGLLLASCLWYSDYTSFPGINALLPTAGAAMLILGARAPSTMSNRLLSSTPARFFGDISYSLYLWHWPIIVFYKLYVNPELDPVTTVGLFIASVIVGYLNWKYVELPTRAIDLQKNARPVYISALAASLAFVAFGAGAIWSDGYRFMLSKEKLYYGNYLGYKPHARSGTCFLELENDIASFDESACLTPADNKTNILLVGDSHAAHYYSGMMEFDVHVAQATSSGCRPTTSTIGIARCTELIRTVLSEYVKKYQYDAIILSGRWKYSDIEYLRPTIEILRQHSEQVIVLGPIIEYSQDLPVLLSRFTANGKEMRQFQKARHYEKVAKIDALLKAELKQSPAVYYSVLDIICPEETCATTDRNGVPLQFDYGHLTHEGAIFVLSRVFSSPTSQLL